MRTGSARIDSAQRDNVFESHVTQEHFLSQLGSAKLEKGKLGIINLTFQKSLLRSMLTATKEDSDDERSNRSCRSKQTSFDEHEHDPPALRYTYLITW